MSNNTYVQTNTTNNYMDNADGLFDEEMYQTQKEQHIYGLLTV